MKIISYKKNEKDKFEMLCRKIFNFLEKDFGCRLDSVVRDSYGAYLAYRNSTTGVKISFTPGDGDVLIYLIKLIDGVMPVYPVTITLKDSVYYFELDEVISIKNPTLQILNPSTDEMIKKISTLKEILLQQAEYLKKYAADILKGNFSIFPELEKIVKKRAGVLKRELVDSCPQPQ